MKRCPKCGFETADSDMNFCPNCSHQNGNGLVRLEIVSSPQKSDKQAFADSTKREKGNDPMSAAERIAAAMSATDTAAVKGDANAISGGVHSEINDSRTQTVNVEIKDLSEAERLRQNKAAYHNECVKLIKDGFIDDEGKRQLSALRESLGLHKDIADYIQKEVTEQSVRKRTSLPMAAIQLIERVKGAIERNDKNQIQANLLELDAYKSKMDDDNLDQIYFQLKSILAPDQFIKDYSTSTTSYWEAFWAYVALVKVDFSRAAHSLADLVRWDYHYPYQNQSVLQTIGLLMQDRDQEARESYKGILAGYSADLEPIHFAISELLDRDWDEITDVSPRSKFYIDSLFRKAYDRIRTESDKRKKIIIDIINKGEQDAREIQHRKEDFLQRYEAKRGSISEALLLSGVTQTQFDEWKRSDANFRLALEAIDKRLVQEKEDEERRIEELKEAFLVHYESDGGSISAALSHSGVEQSQFDEWKGTDPSFRKKLEEADSRLFVIREEDARRVKEQKDRLLSFYESYSCDLQKACKEVGISPEIVNEWRKTDLSFNNSINYIKRKYDAKRRKKFLSIVLPCVLIALLCVIIGIRLKSAANTKIEAKNLADRYMDATTNLQAIIDGIPSNTKSISIEKHYNALSAGCDSLQCIIKLEQNTQLKLKKVSGDLKQNILEKADSLYEYAVDLGSTLPDKPMYRELQKEGQSYMCRIDSLKQLITRL